MTKTTWLFAAAFSALMAFALLGLQLHQRGVELRAALSEREESLRAAQAASKTNATLAEEVLAARAEIEGLQASIRQATNAQTDLEKQMRAQLESRDVTISELQGRLTVNILDRVLFDSGAAVLKPEGEKVLFKVAQILSQYPNRQIQVIGHTDNVPIRGVTQGGFADNWELSAGRAVSALRFLQKRAGVDPKRLAAVGYGEFHPLADNASAEGRAKNRRIAVVVLPEEIAPNDLPKTVPGTNAIPARAVATPSAAPIPQSVAPEPTDLKPPTGE
jgi:chemotaxis protein MotB